MVYVNGWCTQQGNTPFGGFKQSGIGRELGQQGVESYMETKTVIINH